jgi:hypothetical protein
MMKIEMAFRRKVIALSIVLGVLVAAYVLGIVFSSGSVQRRQAQELLVPGLVKEAVQEIQIQASAGSIGVRRQNAGWMVQVQGTELPAQAQRVDSFLGQMIGLKKFRVVSGKPDTWASFEVGPDAGQRIVLKDGTGKAVLDLHVGKRGTGAAGNYVRLEGSNEVVLLDNSLEYYLNSQDDFWSELRLLPKELKGQELIRLSFRSRLSFNDADEPAGQALDYTLLLESGEGGPVWKVEGKDDFPLDTGKVEGVANNVAGFEGARYAVNVPADKAGLESPAAEVTVTARDNKTYRLRVGNTVNDEDQYYVRLEGSPYTYQAPAWRVKQILKTLDVLRGEKKE